MTDRRHPLLQRLLDLPTPLECKSSQWLGYDRMGIDETNVPILIGLMFDEKLNAA